MSFLPYIQNTPVWVWVLFIYLLHRGINALFDREMRPGRLFFLPIFFLLWGIYGITRETFHPDISLFTMLIGVLAGIAFGYLLWRSQPPLRHSDTPGFIIRAGTPLTLGLIIIAFGLKYILTATVYLHPELREAQSFSLLFGLLTGLVDGIFWGGTLRVFVPWYKKERQRKQGTI
ncbi:DUF6622 family protein [Kosakonia oryzendophytica]|uniref:DUF6622 family protein n=1 Tax=Kosakonia oryzendophytica TaxID=1005665 RepID=UPI003D34803C